MSCLWQFTELEIQSHKSAPSQRVLQRSLAFPYLAELLCHHSLSSQAEEVVKKKPRATAEVSSRKCQQTLAELESVLSHLEGLFARTLVPRVLIDLQFEIE